MNNSHKRWYIDPVTELATIRPHSGSHDYLTPDEVKRMVRGQADDVEPCPTCGGDTLPNDEPHGHYE